MMSFGQTGHSRANAGFPVIRHDSSCPCGSGERFGECCRPILDGEPAPTAERLMRSRYSAFVIGDADYLQATWHPGTRPERLELDPELRWRGLEVVAADAGQPGDRRGTVEFRAWWREDSKTHVLEEVSRFVFQSERWWYLDGRVRPDPSASPG